MIIITPHLNLAYIYHKGPIQAEGFIQLVMDLAFHPLYIAGINILYDYRNADFSSVQQKDLDRFYAYLQIQRKNLYNRVAIVVAKDDDDIADALLQINCRSLPHKRKIFTSISRGESWLFETAPPQVKKRYRQMDSHWEMVKSRCAHHVMDQNGTIIKSTVTDPVDGIPLPGRNISDILHRSYAYPFQCLLRRVLKTQKRSWINLRVRNDDYASRIIAIGSRRAHVSEFLISGMGTYEVERLKWLAPKNNTSLPAAFMTDAQAGVLSQEGA